MFWIGCHLSAAKGYLAMGKTAKRIGANTFQFFTRNPRGGSVKALDLEDIAAYRAFAKENGFGKILAHAPYTLNACAADARVLAFARQVMQEDLERLAHLPEAMYNFHPGSHVKQGEEIGIVKIADMLNCVLTEEIQTKVLLETMAGKGTEVGRTFEQLAAILARVERKEQMGVCLDTCHVFDGGYDIVSDWEGVLRQFDEIIGLESLCAVHLNDSKNPLGSRKDRHACLGEGTIGHMAIAEVICHPKLRDVPFLLETPNELEGYAREIAWLRTIRKGE
ncbi:MAG TPA: deoxyribonuclease IV [Candidatus Anaerotignum merdipullorum]|nr:deoxyribonuclease IV [Candidatus Anaerotignum merdipullorum]